MGLHLNEHDAIQRIPMHSSLSNEHGVRCCMPTIAGLNMRCARHPSVPLRCLYLVVMASTPYSQDSQCSRHHCKQERACIIACSVTDSMFLAAFSAGFAFLPETKAYTHRKQAELAHPSESRSLASFSASVNGFDSEHPRRSVFGSFSSHKKETGIFRAHMIVSPLVAWHEVNDMWHELKDIVVHTLSRSTSYARYAALYFLQHAGCRIASEPAMQGMLAPARPSCSTAGTCGMLLRVGLLVK